MAHKHKWFLATVDPKKPGKRKAKAREGLIRDDGLVVTAPSRADKYDAWFNKMTNQPRA